MKPNKKTRKQQQKQAFYDAYISSSPIWKEKRDARLQLDRYECQTCCNTDDLEVHHKHYNTLGHENIHTDLITLCSTCHQAITNVIRGRRYAARDIAVTITHEATTQDRTDYVDRETISINITSPVNLAQRPDRRPVEQIFQNDKSDLIETRKNGRGL